MTYTVSGDAEHIYVSDESGRIIAMCDQLHDAQHVADALNADLPALLKRAGWGRVGAVGTRDSWVQP